MTKLWIGILPVDATDTGLIAFFSSNGITPYSAVVVRDRTSGESRRIGVAEVDDADAAITATNDKKMGDYTLRVTRWRS